MKTALLCGILFICTSGLLALTGYGTSAPVANDTVDPVLTLLAPNGGEAWYIGDTRNITWTASDTNLVPNSVYLWYSLNGGTDFLPLASAIANDGTEPWALPSVQTNNARVQIKVSDSFGNFTQTISAADFSITYVPPAEPQGLTVSIVNAVDALITWQAVTQTIPPYNTPITPDGYIVLYNETPYTSSQYYSFVAMTTGLSYTHHDVARFLPRVFYHVIAFKDYRGALARILQPAIADPQLRLSLAEIEEALASLPLGGGK